MGDLLTQKEQNEIREYFGEEFFVKVREDIKEYSQKWNLSTLSLIPYYSVNCIFSGRSKQYGDVILKIGRPSKEMHTECLTLKEYAGNGCCRLYESNPERGILLEERIFPGTMLRDEPLLERRLDVYCSIFESIHVPIVDGSRYPLYSDWIENSTAYMSKQNEYKELYHHMKTAKEMYARLCKTYKKEMLLHGDLHHDNILLGQDGRYKVIDPKGVIGDPVFEIGRFILNEPYQEAEEPSAYIKVLLHGLSKRLGLPQSVLRMLFYIELTMGACWSMEDQTDDYGEVLQSVEFAASMV